MTPPTSGQHRRWLFGDQLGPHFLDGPQQRVVLVESSRMFTRRTVHRQKAHLLLSAMRHRAAELGDRAQYVRAATFRRGLAAVAGPLDVVQPTSYAAARLVADLSAERPIDRWPARGFATARADFIGWASRQRGDRLDLADFYRATRTRLGVLVAAPGPTGGRWSAERDPPSPRPNPLPDPYQPVEDEIDAQVRADLDALAAAGVPFIGVDGPRRFPATRAEALTALADFIDHRLPGYGSAGDRMCSAQPWSDRSLLSVPLNLGLLDPMEVVRAAEQAYAAGLAPRTVVEAFVGQVLGERELAWHLYWFLGLDYRWRNDLHAYRSLPDWLRDLDPTGTDAACLQHAVRAVRDTAWTHDPHRLTVLGNYALQQGFDPAQLTGWFQRSFADGTDWATVAAVVGRSQYADSGAVSVQPHLVDGSGIDVRSDYCGDCVFDPGVAVGPAACPFTAGSELFLRRHRELFADDRRRAQLVGGPTRLSDLEQVLGRDPD